MISTTFASDLYYASKHTTPCLNPLTIEHANVFHRKKTSKKAYHGSPFVIEAFQEAKEADKAKMLFGHGLYFTAAQDVAERYRLPRYTDGHQNEVRVKTPQGILPLSQVLPIMATLFINIPVDMKRLQDVITYTVRGKEQYGNLETAEKVVRFQWEDAILADAVKILKEEGFEPLRDGFLYEVSLTLDDDKMLYWDKPWAQQSSHAQHRLQEYASNVEATLSISEWYKQESAKTSAQEVSERLEKWGFDGICYAEPKDPGTYNYVVFNPSQVNIDVVHDNNNKIHVHNTHLENKTFAELNDQLLTTQINKDLKDSIKKCYQKEGISAQKLSPYYETLPLLTLIKDNYIQGKRGPHLLDGMMLYRGTKDMNHDLGSFQGDFLHTTPIIGVAHGYALTTNDDIGFNATSTKGIGKLTAYPVPENVIFHQNFGLEENQSGLTADEITAQITPLLENYINHPSDVTRHAIEEYLNIHMYEVGLARNTEPVNTYVCMDKVLYPMIPAFEPIQTRMTDLNHASLLNYGLKEYLNRLGSLEHRQRLAETAPEQWATLQRLQHTIVQTVNAYQNTTIPQSASLDAAETHRLATLNMLSIEKIGQSDGFIGFQNHPQLQVLESLKKEFNDAFNQAMETEKIWCQTTIKHHLEQHMLRKQHHELFVDRVLSQISERKDTLTNNTETFHQKKTHLSTLHSRIMDREANIRTKKKGLLGWFYSLTSEKKDTEALRKDKKYYNHNREQLHDLHNVIKENNVSIQQLIESHHAFLTDFAQKEEDHHTAWSSFAQQYHYLIAQAMGIQQWKPTNLPDFMNQWKGSIQNSTSIEATYLEAQTFGQ